MNDQVYQQQAAGGLGPGPSTDPRAAQREQNTAAGGQAAERQAQSDSLRLAMEMSRRIQQQTQNLIRDRIMNVQKQVQEQAAEHKKNTVTRQVVSVVEKQVNQQANLAKSFRERISNANAPLPGPGAGASPGHHNTINFGQLRQQQFADSFNQRDTGSTLQQDMAAAAAGPTRQPTVALNMQALQKPGATSGLGQAQLSKQRPTPSFKLHSQDQLELKMKNGSQQEKIAESGSRDEQWHGAGVQQVPVEDEVEPGHVPIAEIIKANHIEMQQQSGFQRPPSSKQKAAPELVQRAEAAYPGAQKQQKPLKLDASSIKFGAAQYQAQQQQQMPMHQTLQESQQSGSGGNEGDQIAAANGRANPSKRALNMPAEQQMDTDGDRDEEQEQLNDIRQRANVLKDFSVNMNTDDQLDDDANTLDKDSQGLFTAGGLGHSLDLGTHGANTAGAGHADEGPKMARNMGFPNMKYLDPDALGPPIQEKTLYKEFQQNKDNDIKLQREGFINARQDMANNTFIKLFQASENPDKREELQSVQYAEQILDDDTSGHEDTQIIVQHMGQKTGKYMDSHQSSLQQSQENQMQQSANKAKSKSLGKIGDHHVQDQSMRIRTRRKNSQASRQMILSPEKSANAIPRQQQQNVQQHQQVQSQPGGPKSSQQLPPLQNPQNLGLRHKFLLDQSNLNLNNNSISYNQSSVKPSQAMQSQNLNQSHISGNQQQTETYYEHSHQVLKAALPGFQAPQGMTQVPMMFSGSIPSLQYQDSSKGILHMQHQQMNALSPAQAFLNQQLSHGQGHLGQNGAASRQSGLLPPILQHQQVQMVRFQSRADQAAAGARFSTQPSEPGKLKEVGHHIGHTQAQNQSQHQQQQQQQHQYQPAPFQIGAAHRTLDNEPSKLRVINRIGDQEQSLQQKFASPRTKNSTKHGSPVPHELDLLDQLMPSSDIINDELMNNFGGKELSVQHEMQRSGALTSGHSPGASKGGHHALRLQNRSCMSTQSPEVNIEFDPAEDKRMREILDQYRQIMSTGQTSKENLCLKKLRFHHPWLRELSFNAFKMLFDLCEVVQIKKGEKLFKQDARITDIYFIMYGKLALNYFGNNGVEELDQGGYLGLSLGEELLFYEEPLYRETAVCVTSRCCALQIRAEYIMELGDENFMNRGLNSEAMKQDMDLLFERLSHIYNRKERWRIAIAAKEAEAAKANETQYTQFIKSQ